MSEELEKFKESLKRERREQGRYIPTFIRATLTRDGLVNNLLYTGGTPIFHFKDDFPDEDNAEIIKQKKIEMAKARLEHFRKAKMLYPDDVMTHTKF
jgi:hypothetical protein